MKRILMFAVGFAFVLTLVQPAPAQDLASSLVGVWKLTSVTRTEVATDKTEKPYGEMPTGYYIYTRGGHFLWNIVADNRKAPGSAPTDAERIELFKSLSFGSGTYKVEGNKVLYRYDSSWHQVWTGTERAGAPEITGTKMTLKSAPFKNPTGVDVFVVNTYQRVE